ncbi:MAG: endonuclease III [Gammaproteobacteria bacterium]|nr:endonuclease III [Gammaproteobacteria bacterium]
MRSSYIQPFFTRLKSAHPNPQTELHFANTFQLLVAVILSAQATDKSVNLVTEKLFAQITTPEQMLAYGLLPLQDSIRTIGLYKTKAKNILATSAILVNRYHSQIPNQRESLETLPGVGRKTANVVLNIAFGQPTIAVDTHVFRVSNRTGLGPGKTPLEVENALLKVIPEEFIYSAHHLLILQGRYVCKARRPLCEFCSVKEFCNFFNEL